MVKLVFIAEPEEPTYDSMSELIDKVNEWADERNLKQADPKIQWMRKDLTIATIILLVSLAINMLSVYYVLTVPRRVETVTIHRVDNVGTEMHGKVTGKEKINDLYTIDCGAYGKFLVSKEQYNSVNVGDDIPSYLRGRGQ